MVCVLLVKVLLPSDEVEAGGRKVKGTLGHQAFRAGVALHEELPPVSDGTRPRRELPVSRSGMSRVGMRAANVIP